MSRIEPILLQRLIDGELDVSNVQSLLKDADHEPAMWKEIATAFIEDRLWQNSFVDDLIDERPDAKSVTSTSTDVAVNLSKPVMTNRFNFAKWLSMAAAVLIACSLGYLIGNSGVLNSTIDLSTIDHSTNRNAVADGGTSVGAKTNDAFYKPDYRMQLEQPGFAGLDHEIPLYKSERAKELGLSLEPDSISDELHRRLKRSGYGLEQNVRYFSGQMSDGQQFVVPIRRIQFTPNQ